MARFSQHFWSHILWTSTKGISELRGPYPFPTETKISNFQISIHVNHNIFRFDVSINNFFAVQVLNAHQNFNEAVPGFIFCHSSNFS